MTRPADTDPPFTVKRRELIADAGNMRLSEYTLAPGESIPWHFHSNVSDWYVCMVGKLRVETRAPAATHDMVAGETASVPPLTAHHVSNTGNTDCRFSLVQGIGVYDFQPVGRTSKPR